MKMKAAIPLLLLCASWQYALCKSVSTSVKDDVSSKTDKRALVEGNAGVNKREQLGSPGIEYANTRESLPDKSPSQQVYATSVPQLAKISDVLTGHGAAFPTAIANHLYSVLPVYQSKVSPAYEVSAPVPSNLAYAEHKIIYPALPHQINSIQYYQQPQKLFMQPPNIYHKPENIGGAAIINYSPQPIQRQEISYLQQPLAPAQNQYHLQQYTQAPQQYTHGPQQYSQVPQQYSQVPQQYSQVPQQYSQAPQQYSQSPQQFITYSQPGYLQLQPYQEQSHPGNTRPQTFNQSPSTYSQNAGVTYVQPQPTVTYKQQLAPPVQFSTSQAGYLAPGVDRGNQRDLNSQPINVIDKGSDVDNQAIKNEVKSQGAVSFASFSQGTSANLAQAPPNGYLPSATKPTTVASKAQAIPALDIPTGPSYVQDGQPIAAHVVRYYPPQNFYQATTQQVYLQQPTYHAPRSTYQTKQLPYVQQSLPAGAPAFPAVQYFGKHAQTLLGGYAQ